MIFFFFPFFGKWKRGVPLCSMYHEGWPVTGTRPQAEGWLKDESLLSHMHTSITRHASTRLMPRLPLPLRVLTLSFPYLLHPIIGKSETSVTQNFFAPPLQKFLRTRMLLAIAISCYWKLLVFLSPLFCPIVQHKATHQRKQIFFFCFF